MTSQPRSRLTHEAAGSLLRGQGGIGWSSGRLHGGLLRSLQTLMSLLFCENPKTTSRWKGCGETERRSCLTL